MKSLILSLLFLSSTVQAQSICQSLFANLNTKETYIERAYQKISLAKPDDKVLQPILDRWDLENSTPWKLEVMAQNIALSQHKLDKNFLQRFIAGLWGTSNFDYVNMRYQTLALKDELVFSLQQDGLLQKNTFFDNSKRFFNKNTNKMKLARAFFFNYLSYHFFGVPIYIPFFNFAANLNLDKSDLALIKKYGIEKAYPYIKQKYKIPLWTQTFFDKTPRAIMLSGTLSLAYAYYYMKIDEKPEVIIPENVISQESPIYAEWKKKFEELNGRAPNLGTPEDFKQWEFQENVVYRVWADKFTASKGRSPDLKKPDDLRSWQAFLDQFHS